MGPPPTSHRDHIAASNIGGIVLCGGLSSRMRQAKALLPFGHEVLLQRIVRIVGAAVSPVVVVAAREQQLPKLPEDVLVARDEHESLGPLAGLAVGLKALRDRATAAYASSCDVPLLRAEFVAKMAGLLGSHEIVVPREGEFLHPLAAVYRTSLAGRAEALVSAGRLRPLDLIEQSDTLQVDVETLRDVDPRLDSLRNVNTPEEYAAALAGAAVEVAGGLVLNGTTRNPVSQAKVPPGRRDLPSAMLDPSAVMVTFVKLAAVAHDRAQLPQRDKFLLLGGAAASEAGEADVADRCREVVAAHNPQHAISRFATFAEALADPEYQAFHKQLLRFCSYEQAEYFLDQQGLSTGLPSPGTVSHRDYAMLVLGRMK